MTAETTPHVEEETKGQVVSFMVESSMVETRREILHSRSYTCCGFKLIKVIFGSGPQETYEHEWTFHSVPAYVHRNVLLDFAVLMNVLQLRMQEMYVQVDIVSVDPFVDFVKNNSSTATPYSFTVPSSWTSKTLVKKVKELKKLITLPLDEFKAVIGDTKIALDVIETLNKRLENQKNNKQ